MRHGASLVVAAVAAAALACGGGSRFSQQNTPDNLKALLQTIRTTGASDQKAAAAMIKSLLPDGARLRKGLKDDVPADTVQKILAGYQRLASGEEAEMVRAFADPERTEVQVHGATTEQIRTYEDGSVAFKEFPGGARTLAERILKPGLTFYEAEYLKPGSDSGMKFHLFYWDGAQWTMLGPVWRFVQ
jgi:hypothetical protein